MTSGLLYEKHLIQSNFWVAFGTSTLNNSYNRLKYVFEQIISIAAVAEFLESKRYLDLADNNAPNSSDKFAKVRPLFNTINEQCIFNYQPIQHVSIDESMVPYFGKHGTKQYIHSKATKFRFKIWFMATPLEYCIQFHPYPGKDSIL